MTDTEPVYPGEPEEEDLLMPGASGAWGDGVVAPRPPAPRPTATPTEPEYLDIPADQPLPPSAPEGVPPPEAPAAASLPVPAPGPPAPAPAPAGPAPAPPAPAPAPAAAGGPPAP
ncbi:Cys/Met metabolism pyridoxal-phosphate-dependent enzyme, partial [Streptomyces sp. DSM 44917]|nr:Cys/Met metabolism pyridoxal-phosphate-dependent enzyme [Streptomyces sp. DSM 44917]